MATATDMPPPPHTPVQHGADSVYRNQQEIPQGSEAKQQLNRDIMKMILGTAPTDEFFDLVMPIDPSLRHKMQQAIANADFSKVYDKNARPVLEKHMYDPLVGVQVMMSLFATAHASRSRKSTQGDTARNSRLTRHLTRLIPSPDQVQT